MRKADRIAMGVPAALVVVVLLMNLIPAWRQADLRLYDQFLRLRPTIEEDDRFLILQVDDESITRVGAWPWSRDVIANGLLTMKELGVDRAVFDIEYMDRSPAGVDRTLLEQQIPDAVASTFSSLLTNSLDLLEAVADGRLPARDALDFSGQLVDSADREQDNLLGEIGEIARDNDEYMGRAAEVFERAFYTITLLDIPQQIAPTTPEDLEFARERYALAEAPEEHNLARPATIQPVIRPIGSRSAGAGFTNVVVDPDGVRRRINLLADYEGTFIGQLSFVPLWDLFGQPEISVDGRTITLHGAELPGEDEATDIDIPLSYDYRLLINWPQKGFVDSFRQASYASIMVYDELVADLQAGLEIMEDANYFQFYDGTPPTSYYHYAEELKRDIMAGDLPSERYEEYIQVRDGYFAEIARLLDGDTEEELVSYIEGFLENDLSNAEREEFEEVLAEARGVFADVGELFGEAEELRAELRSVFDDAFVIIGQTGVGTVDIGVNPFEGQYFNVGTHAALANTVFQQNFLVEEPRWVSLLVAAAAGLIVTFGTARLDSKKSLLFGVFSLILVAAGGAGWFAATGRYLPMVTPLSAIAIAFVASSAVSSIRNSAERAFLRNAFSRYLSADVIGQIIDDPSKLALGGEKKNLTAMFTDIQGFSTISEKLDPSDLVRLLNAYLTEMSNIVLDVRGTIDKYEGDAIIAFFGAPVDDPEHARHACQSAIRMKRIEVDLNERFLSENMTPSPLATRIGINTGDMVVGNMGTERKMDYTIMGHAVNLAARLEGVNKQYGSYILVSEATANEAGEDFLFRPLDLVRVVGVSEPVQLYELLDERSAASSELIERVAEFRDAIQLFREQKFVAAGKLFSDLAKRSSGDPVSSTYANRCIKLEKEPPSASWDGVYNLTQK